MQAHNFCRAEVSVDDLRQIGALISAMQLRVWRKAQKLTLEVAAGRLGLKSAGALCDIERGKTFPSPETIAGIEGGTRDAVLISDLWSTWRHARPIEFAAFRAAGRTAPKSPKPATKRKNHYG